MNDKVKPGKEQIKQQKFMRFYSQKMGTANSKLPEEVKSKLDQFQSLFIYAVRGDMQAIKIMATPNIFNEEYRNDSIYGAINDLSIRSIPNANEHYYISQNGFPELNSALLQSYYRDIIDGFILPKNNASLGSFDNYTFDFLLQELYNSGPFFDISIDVDQPIISFLPYEKLIVPSIRSSVIIGAGYDRNNVPYLITQEDTTFSYDNQYIRINALPYPDYLKQKRDHKKFIKNPQLFLIGGLVRQKFNKMSFDEDELLKIRRERFSNRDYYNLFAFIVSIDRFTLDRLDKFFEHPEKTSAPDDIIALINRFNKVYKAKHMAKLYIAMGNHNLEAISDFEVFLPEAGNGVDFNRQTIFNIDYRQTGIKRNINFIATSDYSNSKDSKIFNNFNAQIKDIQNKLRILIHYHQYINFLDDHFGNLKKEEQIWTQIQNAYNELKLFYYKNRFILEQPTDTERYIALVNVIFQDSITGLAPNNKDMKFVTFINSNAEAITNKSFELCLKQFLFLLKTRQFDKFTDVSLDNLLTISKAIASQTNKLEKQVFSRDKNFSLKLQSDFIQFDVEEDEVKNKKKLSYKKTLSDEEVKKIILQCEREYGSSLLSGMLFQIVPDIALDVYLDRQFGPGFSSQSLENLNQQNEENNSQSQAGEQHISNLENFILSLDDDSFESMSSLDQSVNNMGNAAEGNISTHRSVEDGVDSTQPITLGEDQQQENELIPGFYKLLLNLDYNSPSKDYKLNTEKLYHSIMDEDEVNESKNSSGKDTSQGGPKNLGSSPREGESKNNFSKQENLLEDFSAKRTQGTADQLKETISQLCSYYHITEGELRQLLELIKDKGQVFDNNSIKEFIKEIKRSNGIEAPEKRSINFDIDRSVLTLSQLREMSSFMSIKRALQKSKNRQAEIVPFRVIQKNNPLEQTLFMKKVAGGEGMFILPSSKIDSSQQFIPPTGGGGGSSGGGGGKPPTIKLKLIKSANRMGQVTSYGKEFSFMFFPFAAEMGSKYIGSYFTDNSRTIEAIGDSSWGVSIPLYYVANAYRSNPLATKAALGNYAKLAGQIGRSSGIVVLKTIPTAAKASPKVMVVAAPFILTKLLIEAPKRVANSSDEVMCLYQYGALNFRQTSYYLNPDHQGRTFIPDRVESKRLQTGHNHSFTLSGDVYYINQSMINRLKDPVFQLNQYKNYSISMDSNVKSPTLNHNKNKTDVKKLTTVSK